MVKCFDNFLMSLFISDEVILIDIIEFYKNLKKFNNLKYVLYG